MKTNLHLVFPGTCAEAFAFYEKALGTKRTMSMKYGEAPGGMPIPADSAELVMHTSMQVGGVQLMGCDAPRCEVPNMAQEKLGGFQVSLESEDEAEVRRIYDALSEGGSRSMPLAPTFWSPLFGMLKDRFGVGWMVSVPGPQQAS
ncbi:MAG TPA: VOC family protein [Acidobacteriaceae bacterium]|nr:VOC family protein [Acidobacteriaceae bacterium]